MRQVVGDQHHQRRGLERAGPAHRVEGILQVVGASSDRDAGAPERIDGGEPAGHGLLVAAAEPQVGVGERDHPDAGGGDEFGDALLLDRVTLAEADAVAGGDLVREPGEYLAGQVLQAHHARIERLVGVQVDADAGVRRDLEKHVGGPFDLAVAVHVILQVGAATDDIGTCGDRISQQGAVLCSGGADDRRAGQRHDLDVDQVGDSSAHLDECLDVAEAAELDGVGVGANGDVPVGRHQAHGALGSFDDVVDGDPVAHRDHRIDGAGEVARAVLDAFGEECLVEMGVRFDGRWEQQRSVEVHDVARPPVPSAGPTSVIVPSTIRTSTGPSVTAP